MKNLAKTLPVLALIGAAAFAWREYFTPERQLARARARLESMERQGRRDAIRRQRTEDDAERARFARPSRFRDGTRGKRLDAEAAADKRDDVNDWYEDRQAGLEAQRAEVKRLEGAIPPPTEAEGMRARLRDQMHAEADAVSEALERAAEWRAEVDRLKGRHAAGAEVAEAERTLARWRSLLAAAKARQDELAAESTRLDVAEAEGRARARRGAGATESEGGDR